MARYTTDQEMAGMLRRVMRAYCDRVATAGTDELADLLDLQAHFDREVQRAVNGLRENGSYSWAEIGALVGMTRQGAQQRWGR